MADDKLLPADFVARLDAVVSDPGWNSAIPGYALAVADNVGTVFAKGYGVRSLETEQPVTEDTIFGIASCSKSFAAATVGLLVDEGAVHWDDTVNRHLPDFRLYDPWVSEQLTVRDLLSMRTGIAGSEALSRRVSRNRVDHLRRMRYLPRTHSFRERYGYTTDTYTVVGELVTRVVGTDWADFARQRLWRPLGMRRTNADRRRATRMGNTAQPHVWVDGRWTPIEWVYEDHVATPAGGVNSSVSDMAKWLRIHLDAVQQDILPRHVVRAMQTPETNIGVELDDSELAQVLGIGQDGVRFYSYAFGWVVGDWQGRTIVRHDGSIDGFRCAVGFLPEEGVAAVALVNAASSYFSEAVLMAALGLAVGDERDWFAAYAALEREAMVQKRTNARRLEDARLRGTSPSLPMASYAGRYQDNGLFGQISIDVDDGKLSFVAEDQRYVLEHWHLDVFRAHLEDRPWDELRAFFLTFVIDESGVPQQALAFDDHRFVRMGR